MIADGHDIFCDCKAPFAHLLDSIFPEGHTDRNKPICHIIKRDYQLCHSGGPEDESHGIQLGESAATFVKEEKEDTREDLDDLLCAAAAAAAEDSGTR